MLLKIRNTSFRMKMTLLFAVVCIFSASVSGMVYYRFAEKEIVSNFTQNAQGLTEQMKNTMDTRLGAVSRRVFSALTNRSFIQPLGEYLSSPTLERQVVLSSEAANWLKDIGQAEPLVHSVMLCTDKGYFDDYTRVRKWDFDFSGSSFAPYFNKTDSEAVQWLPAMKDEIFDDKDTVIPYVRRFTVERYREDPSYLIVQLDQRVLMKELTGSIGDGEHILITDQKGNYIGGTLQLSEEERSKLAEKAGHERAEDNKIEIRKENYLLYHTSTDINQWNIYILKSQNELLDNVRRLRNLIMVLTPVFIGISWVVAAFLSKQMTSSLERLSVQMNRMRQGEMDARYYYPYKDEIGSLAKTFNYMADEIELSMKKQEEYIALLQEEKEFAEQMQRQKRKAELRALQAQINPHFLYNTLNTITWMASDVGADEIRVLSNSLGKFFRIALSRGAEVITIKEEIEHIKSYLSIQEIRYAEIMEYSVDIPMELEKFTTLKLVLQPLVENAIYHGIKPKTGKNRIKVSAQTRLNNSGKWDIVFVVEDSGVGIAPEKLDEINQGLEAGRTGSNSGYGIYNVNERIKLYYGTEYGLYFESVQGEWTKAVLIIPVQEERERDV